MVDAIIFDCDGVLIDSEIAGLDDSALFLQQHGFSWVAEDLVQFTGLRQDVLMRKLTEEYTRILRRSPTNQESLIIFEGLVAARRANRDKVTVISGVEDLLANIVTLPPAIAVASSSQTEFLEGKLKRFGLWDHFVPHIYSADRVGAGKPAPDVFLYTAERLGVEPSQCLVIEDSVNGVKAGVAAGMTVWGFTGGGHCFDGHGDRLAFAGTTNIVSSHAALNDRLIQHLTG